MLLRYAETAAGAQDVQLRCGVDIGLLHQFAKEHLHGNRRAVGEITMKHNGDNGVNKTLPAEIFNTLPQELQSLTSAKSRTSLRTAPQEVALIFTQSPCLHDKSENTNVL